MADEWVRMINTHDPGYCSGSMEIAYLAGFDKCKELAMNAMLDREDIFGSRASEKFCIQAIARVGE